MHTTRKVGTMGLLTTHYSLLTLKLKRNFQKFKAVFSVIFFSLIFSFFPSQSAYAYTTNMSASVVVGQVNFTSTSANQGGTPGASTVNGPRGIAACNGKLFIADRANNRVLVFNTFPTTSNPSADVVIGQQNFTSNSSNQGGSAGANTLGTPSSVSCTGNKLIIGDPTNNRVLIFNNVPTSNNASADVVVGQADFTSSSINQGGSCAANALRNFTELNASTDGQRLLVGDAGNHRVLIWNSIPTTNNASADVVVGQANFTSCSANQGGSAAANTLQQPRSMFSDGSKLYVADAGNNRVLVYNSIPQTNGVSADVVIGQSSFSGTSANQGGSVAANTLNFPNSIVTHGSRLIIGDQSNNRILIFNSIPSSNNASADIVLGQQNFTSNSQNQGGSATANTITNIYSRAVYDEKLIAADLQNNRILIFENLLRTPGLNLNNSAEGRPNNQLRMTGTATVSDTYTVKNVEFSINGGSWSGATATDGGFDETSEEYYFDFTSTSNQPKDSNGNLVEGYTVRVKATNNNAETIDNVFYFSPFDLHGPSDNTTVTTSYPSFEFSVNKQRTNLRDNLSKYRVLVRKGGSDSSANWETLIDDIPIDFRSVKNNTDNKQKDVYGGLDTNNGVYETDKFYAAYSDESSRIKVYSKINSMSGTYQWKIVAVDKAGHTQEAGARNLYVNATSTATTNYFPLAVLNISGLGNPFLNSYNLSNIKSNYYTSSSNPIFYGIAWTNSKITLKLTDQNCKTDCTKTYSTTANAESRYGINVPKGDLSYGKKYTANLSVALEGKYNELPQFTLSISGPSSPNKTTSEVTQEENEPSNKEENKETSPSPSPAPTSITTQENQERSKRCIWFICW